MKQFITRSPENTRLEYHNTERAALEHAQAAADETGSTIGVYELRQQLRAQPQVATCGIGEVIAKLNQHHDLPVRAILYGIVKQLELDGVPRLVLPPGFKGL